MTIWLRVGPLGDVVGPFADRAELIAWLVAHDFVPSHEGATWKAYTVFSPDEWEPPR